MGTEAKRHHYIPQFILKNYSNSNGQISYWDIHKNRLGFRNTKSVFMNFNMYRDEKNHPDNPTIIETKLAAFESEISVLIHDKFIGKDEITITRSELEKLRIFMQLLSFRSDLRMNQYKQKNFTAETEQILWLYQDDGDYEDLWKKQLFELADCRSIKDIEDNAMLDPAIKLEFKNMLEGYYMTIVDARGGEFMLSDVFPTLEVFPIGPDINVYLHELYPISPTRMILLNHIIFKKEIDTSDPFIKPMYQISRIKDNMIKQPHPKYAIGPSYFVPEDLFTYHPVKIYDRDLSYINALILNEVRNGIMFLNKEKIIPSVIRYNERDDTKLNYSEFEKALG